MDPEQVARLPLEDVVASSDQSCEVPEVPPAGIQCDNRSQPPKVGFHLRPRDVVASFSEGSIECGDILGFFERFEPHIIVLTRTHHHRRTPSIMLKFNRFGLRHLDYLGEPFACFTDRYFDYRNIVQYSTMFCTISCSRPFVTGIHHPLAESTGQVLNGVGNPTRQEWNLLLKAGG